ncbi:RNA polymerase subunit sigma-24, partial [Streptomyces sp. NPDC002044]
AATTINCPIGTVRSRVARARTTLITLLTDTTPTTPTTRPLPHGRQPDRTTPGAALVASVA